MYEICKRICVDDFADGEGFRTMPQFDPVVFGVAVSVGGLRVPAVSGAGRRS